MFSKFIRNLFKEVTHINDVSPVTFNASGNYNPKYGKQHITVVGKGGAGTYVPEGYVSVPAYAGQPYVAATGGNSTSPYYTYNNTYNSATNPSGGNPAPPYYTYNNTFTPVVPGTPGGNPAAPYLEGVTNNTYTPVVPGTPGGNPAAPYYTYFTNVTYNSATYNAPTWYYGYDPLSNIDYGAGSNPYQVPGTLVSIGGYPAAPYYSVTYNNTYNSATNPSGGTPAPPWITVVYNNTYNSATNPSGGNPAPPYYTYNNTFTPVVPGTPGGNPAAPYYTYNNTYTPIVPAYAGQPYAAAYTTYNVAYSNIGLESSALGVTMPGGVGGAATPISPTIAAPTVFRIIKPVVVPTGGYVTITFKI